MSTRNLKDFSRVFSERLCSLRMIANNRWILRVPGNTALAKNQAISGFAKDDGTYEYVTVMGAPERIKKRVYVPRELVSFEQFENWILEGNSVLIIHKMDVPCLACNGRGRISKPAVSKPMSSREKAMQPQRTSIADSFCKMCNGSKTTPLPMVCCIQK